MIYLIIAKVLHMYIQIYRQTYIPSDEAGPRGAFAPKVQYRLAGSRKMKILVYGIFKFSLLLICST